MINLFFSFLIYYILFTLSNINCSSNREKHFGKCVYISTETGSKIINLYKYTNKSSYEKNFSINICNDTIYDININETIQKKFDSQIVYYKYINKTNYTILAGSFNFITNTSLANPSILNKIDTNDIYLYKPQSGEACGHNKSLNYSINVIFVNSNDSKENSTIIEYPNVSECNSTFKINYNIEYATDYLLLQITLNNAYFFTGIVFIILGIFLNFLSFRFQRITKIVISLVFGQLIMFNIAMIFISYNTSLKNYLFILIICLGLVVSAPFIYFTPKFEKLYSIISSFSAGYVTGIFIYQIFFYKTNSALSQSILIDVIIISTSSFIALNLVIPRNVIYYPPFIGSYILIRGISLFIYNLSDKGGFGDLHLLIYLIKLQEHDLVEKYFEKDYRHFYIYLIAIGIVLIIGEIIILLKNKNKRVLSFTDLEEDDTIDVNINNMGNLGIN